MTDDALARVDVESIPERTADLAYVAACLLAMSDRPEDAFERLLVAEASEAWWHRRLLAGDDDLARCKHSTGIRIWWHAVMPGRRRRRPRSPRR